MSNGRRFWLPTQKGTELFPKVTQQPTKLIIEGLSSATPLYYAVAARFAGLLKQFHTKAQQEYSLSTMTQLRRHIEWNGARATYINQGGQETLTLQVDAQLVEEIKKHAGEHWKWALVEFDFPMTNNPTVQIYAVIRGTHLDSFQDSAGSSIDPDSIYNHPIRGIAFAGTTPHGDLSDRAEPDPAFQRFQLLIDLRNVAAGDVVVDVYSVASHDADQIIGWTRTVEPHAEHLSDWWTEVINTYAAVRDAYKAQWIAAGLPTGTWSSLGAAQSSGADINTGVDDADLHNMFVGDEEFVALEGYTPPLIVNYATAPYTTQDGAWRYVVVQYDDLNRVISYASTSLLWRDSTTSLTITQPLVLKHYAYEDVHTIKRIPDRGPGRVKGVAFKDDDPAWIWRDWSIDDSHQNDRWMPSGTDNPNWVGMSVLAENVMWPNKVPDEVTRDDPAIHLGVITANVDNGALAFKPTIG